MATPIQSANLPLWLSEDGVIYKQLVCLENWTLSMDTTTTQTDTFCGSVTGVSQPKFSISFSAVCEAAASGTQVTFKDAARWQNNLTPLYFKVQYPSPGSTSNIAFFAGNVYMSASTYVAAVNDALKFTGTFTGNGNLDIDPA